MAGTRTKWVWLILCALNTGCAGTAPFLGDRSASIDADWAARRNEALANRVWIATAPNKPAWSETYRQGFVAGYRTGLENSGSEPTTSFWSKYFSRHRATVDEQAANAEWSAGFHQGSALAQQSGVRALLTAPLSVAHVAPSPPKNSAPALTIAQAPRTVSQPVAPPQKDQAASGRSLFGIDLPRLTLKRQRGPAVPAAPPEAVAVARPVEKDTPRTAARLEMMTSAHPAEHTPPLSAPSISDAPIVQQTHAEIERPVEEAEPHPTADAPLDSGIVELPSSSPLSAAEIRCLSIIQALP
jgi:hypothetical protein